MRTRLFSLFLDMMFSIFNIAVTMAKEILWILLNYGTSGNNGNVPVDIPVESAQDTFKLHALVIGINDYKSLEVPNLLGAVADADAFSNYLIKHLKVPRSQITDLRDAEATRDNIIGCIRNLKDDDRITNGDSILIFYAGHGASGRAPDRWEAGNKKVESIVPYDCRVIVGGSKVRALPDRTLGALLHQLADVKGDNITVIFDCCHSGSGTRKDEVIRGFELRPDEVPVNLDQDIWQEEQGRATAIAAGFSHAGLHSHVLLSACGADELAREEAGRGVFTSALVRVLYQIDTKFITYKDLIRRIPHLPGQNPQCEGVNSSRFLFNGLGPSSSQSFYPVRREGDKYILEAGEVDGITGGMEFEVYSSLELSTGEPLGILRSELDLVKHFESQLLLLSDVHSHFQIPAHSVATPTRYGERQALRLHIPTQPMVPVFQAVAQQLATRSPGQRAIVLVDQDNAELSFALDANGQVEFQLGDVVTTGYGLTRLYHTLPPHVADIQPLIPAATHFFWHLRRQPAKCQLQAKVYLSFHKIVETEELDDNLLRVMKASEDNLNVGGVVDIESDDETWYGMTIQNKSLVGLYVSVFYFDCSDLSISSYYMPPTATSTSRVDPPLRPEGSLPIGYGAGGSPPSRYRLKPNQTLDVGYIKLFISTHAVDLSSIPQPSPFSGKARDVDHMRPLPTPTWDVITVAVIQRPKGTIRTAKEKVAPVL